MKKSGQGMRQPQLGGINGDLTKAGSTGMLCRHNDQWRRAPGYPWRCNVCHPPASPEGVERR